MMTGAAGWVRWLNAGLLSLLGILLAGPHVWRALVAPEPALATVVTIVVPLGFASLLIYGGYWTLRRNYRAEHTTYLLLWSVVGGTGVAAISLLLFVDLTLDGVTIQSPQFPLAAVVTVGTVLGFLIGIYDVRNRRKAELVISLQRSTTALIEAESRDEVAQIAVDITRSVLDMPITGIWLYDHDEGALVPAAITMSDDAEIETVPTYRAGNSLSWRAFETGEPLVVEDLPSREGCYNPETSLRSEIVLPLGDEGVINIGATEANAFSDTELVAARILASTTTAALEQANDRELLRERQDALERQNERLDQFASVLSHDLRNPLSVANGRLELLAGECESDHIEPIRAAHDRMDQLIGDLLVLAREGRSVDRVESVDLRAVAEDTWQVVETPDASLVIEDGIGNISADRTRLQQLLENLFRNSIEHGREDVTIRVGPTDRGFYVADDGPGIDDTESVFQMGYTTSEDGTGFGLAIVTEIVEAHDWTIDVGESETGGARFEIAVGNEN